MIRKTTNILSIKLTWQENNLDQKVTAMRRRNVNKENCHRKMKRHKVDLDDYDDDLMDNGPSPTPNCSANVPDFCFVTARCQQ